MNDTQLYLAVAVEDLKQHLAAMEARLTERMRDMQSELLRGFETFSTGQTIRLRKLEADTRSWIPPSAGARMRLKLGCGRSNSGWGWHRNGGAMNYELRILVAEKELAHLRELQAIMRSHQDTHDQGFVAVTSRLDRIDANLDKLVAAQLVTEQKLQGLIDILTREHSK